MGILNEYIVTVLFYLRYIMRDNPGRYYSGLTLCLYSTSLEHSQAKPFMVKISCNYVETRLNFLANRNDCCTVNNYHQPSSIELSTRSMREL